MRAATELLKKERGIVNTEKTFNVLVLCTGNSARSILGEVLFNQLGRGRIHAYSAGSKPAGKVNPGALALLQEKGISTEGLRSKSWDEFAAPGAPHFDFIFTVCDKAAGEVCPVWPGQPVTAHWGIEDPAAVQGADEDKRKAFATAYNQLHRRIALFTSLPLDKLHGMSLQGELNDIGKLAERGE